MERGSSVRSKSHCHTVPWVMMVVDTMVGALVVVVGILWVVVMS